MGTSARAYDRDLNAALPPRRMRLFARINTGAVLRGGARARRDDTTFVSVRNYRSGPVAELAIKAPVMLLGLLVTVE